MLFDSFEAYDVQETRRISKAEGKAEGKAEERKNLLEAARTMLNEGMDRLKVQHFTKLTDEEMASL